MFKRGPRVIPTERVVPGRKTIEEMDAGARETDAYLEEQKEIAKAAKDLEQIMEAREKVKEKHIELYTKFKDSI